MAKQGYADRKDESLGMKNGAERGMSQSYKSRRDESYGMGKVMGHDKQPMKCDAFAAQKGDLGRLNMLPKEHKGSPKEAYAYKY